MSFDPVLACVPCRLGRFRLVSTAFHLAQGPQCMGVISALLQRTGPRHAGAAGSIRPSNAFFEGRRALKGLAGQLVPVVSKVFTRYHMIYMYICNVCMYIVCIYIYIGYMCYLLCLLSL